MKTRRELFTLAIGAAAAPVSFALPNGDAIDATLRSGIATRKIPCAVGMLATGDRTLYEGAFGLRDSSGTPVAVDSIFAIASMTKAVTTVAAMQLVQAGKLQLDTPVAKFLPKLENPKVLLRLGQDGSPITEPAKNPITLKQLMTHTSGLCYDIWDGQMFQLSQNKAIPDAGTTLMFQPGTRWQYGTGIDWVGRLVRPLAAFRLRSIFKPIF